MSTKQTQETTKSIRSATGNEAALNALFTQIAQEAGANLGGLGQNMLGGPTAADRDLVEQSIGASGDIARRELERSMEQIMSQVSEQLAARGIAGSSIESMMAGQVGSQGLQSIENLMSREQAQGGQALLNLPFQRAQTEIGRNQALLQRLTSLGGAVQQGGLQERLNTIGQTTTQSQSGGATAMQVGQQLGRLGAAYFTGGASEAALAAGGAAGGGGGAPLWYQGGSAQGPPPQYPSYGISSYQGPLAP